MLAALFLLIGVLVIFCRVALGNDAVDFNSTCVETETCGFSETERMLYKLIGKIDSMDAKSIFPTSLCNMRSVSEKPQVSVSTHVLLKCTASISKSNTTKYY